MKAITKTGSDVSVIERNIKYVTGVDWQTPEMTKYGTDTWPSVRDPNPHSISGKEVPYTGSGAGINHED